MYICGDEGRVASGATALPPPHCPTPILVRHSQWHVDAILQLDSWKVAYYEDKRDAYMIVRVDGRFSGMVAGVWRLFLIQSSAIVMVCASVLRLQWQASSSWASSSLASSGYRHSWINVNQPRDGLAVVGWPGPDRVEKVSEALLEFWICLQFLTCLLSC